MSTDLETGEILNGQDKPLLSWEWIDRAPTTAEIRERLESVPDVYGVRMIDYIDFVQPIGQAQKIPLPPGEAARAITSRGQEPKQWVIKLYVAVAGRAKMLEAAQQIQGWAKIKFVPEPKTQTGSAGILRTGDKIAYRCHLKIWNSDRQLIGVRTGMAERGGANAFASVETAANGRAIAAWGFGVLPGSGVASLDEMQSQDRERPGAGDVVEASNGPDRESLLAQIAGISEATRLLLDQPEEWATNREHSYLLERAQLKDSDIWDSAESKIIWDRVPNQTLANMRLAFEKRYNNERANQP